MAKTNRSSKTKAGRVSFHSQRDGRLFAIKFLRGLGKQSDDEMCAVQKEPWAHPGLKRMFGDRGSMAIYRKGPQSDFALRAFDRIYSQGTREAILGFFVVMTDYLRPAGQTYVEAYEKWERAGKLQYWRLPKGNAAEARHV